MPGDRNILSTKISSQYPSYNYSLDLFSEKSLSSISEYNEHHAQTARSASLFIRGMETSLARPLSLTSHWPLRLLYNGSLAFGTADDYHGSIFSYELYTEPLNYKLYYQYLLFRRLASYAVDGVRKHTYKNLSWTSFALESWLHASASYKVLDSKHVQRYYLYEAMSLSSNGDAPLSNCSQSQLLPSSCLKRSMIFNLFLERHLGSEVMTKAYRQLYAYGLNGEQFKALLYALSPDKVIEINQVFDVVVQGVSRSEAINLIGPPGAEEVLSRMGEQIIHTNGGSTSDYE